jgi:multidrug efflux pump subunit AcrA (membrane-fusion protein)
MARIDAALDPAALAAEPLAVELRVPEHPGHRPARIVRLDPVTDARNQVRYLIAELDRPFAVEPFALPLGTFVNATLRGRALEDTLRVPASALVDDRYLWTVGPGKTLARLPVERLATEDGEVIVRPAEVAGGITVATRPLTTFRPGDPVRLKPAVSSH